MIKFTFLTDLKDLKFVLKYIQGVGMEGAFWDR